MNKLKVGNEPNLTGITIRSLPFVIQMPTWHDKWHGMKNDKTVSLDTEDGNRTYLIMYKSSIDQLWEQDVQAR